MWQSNLMRSLAVSAVSGLSLLLSPIAASAQSSSQSDLGSNASQQQAPSDSFQPVYDLGPAMARYAYAAATYERAYSDLIGTSNRVRNEFYASADYLSAKHAVEDARAAYDQAAAPVLTSVHSDQAYQSAIQNRNQAAQSLKYATAPAMRVELANRKMEFSAQAGRMESDALIQDGNVQQAKAKLVSAQRALDDKTAQVEASLYTNTSVVAVKHAYDQATTTLAGATGGLYGAWIARDDTVDADIRRNSTLVYNYSTPYCGGYYGIGGGYYGLNVGIVRH